MLRAAVAASVLGVVSAQNMPPAVEGYSQYVQQACPWSLYAQGTDWDFAENVDSDKSDACAAACDSTNGCTGFEVGPATSSSYGKTGGYCALWFNGSCSSTKSDMIVLTASQAVATTYVRDAVDVDDTARVTTTVAAGELEMGKDAPHATTVEATSLSDGVYVLKYPQQACAWNDYQEGSDWEMYSASNDATDCAAACVAKDGCTGFEVGADSGSEFGSGPYCAFWLNDACSVPDAAFWGGFSGYVQVDTYTLVAPIDAFNDYEHRACLWSDFEEGSDWEFVSKTSEDPAECAQLCLDSADKGCTGFEVGSSSSMQFGDISQGYCALWYNHSCSVDDMLTQYTTASTYLLIDGSDDCGWGSYSSYYFIMMGTALMLCVLSCCCCRRAMIRRRIAMQRAEIGRAHV